MPTSSLAITAPASGQMIPLANLTDSIFSTGIMGPGFAIRPNDGQILSPVSGKITQVFPTRQFILIEVRPRVICLVHLGIDTDTLNGQGLEPLVSVGDHVLTGDLLAQMDLEFLQQQQKDTTIVTLFLEYPSPVHFNPGYVQAGQIVAQLEGCWLL